MESNQINLKSLANYKSYNINLHKNSFIFFMFKFFLVLSFFIIIKMSFNNLQAAKRLQDLLNNPSTEQNAQIKQKLQTLNQNIATHYKYLSNDFVKKFQLIKTMTKKISNIDNNHKIKIKINPTKLKQQKLKYIKQQLIKQIKLSLIKNVKQILIKYIQQKSIQQINQNINTLIQNQITSKLEEINSKQTKLTQKIQGLANQTNKYEYINQKLATANATVKSLQTIRSQQINKQKQQQLLLQIMKDNLPQNEKLDKTNQQIIIKEQQLTLQIKQIIQISLKQTIQELTNKFIRNDSRKLTRLSHVQLDMLLKEACYGFKIQGENLIKRSQNIYNLKKFVENPVDQTKFLKQFSEKINNEIQTNNNDQFIKNLSDVKWNLYIRPLIQLRNLYQSKIQKYQQANQENLRKYASSLKSLNILTQVDIMEQRGLFFRSYFNKQNHKNFENLKLLFNLFENLKKLFDKYKDNISKIFISSLTKITPSEISQDINKIDIRKIFEQNHILINILNMNPKYLDKLKTEIMNFIVNKKKIQEYKQQKQILQIKLKSNYNESHIKSLNQLKEKINKQRKDNDRISETRYKILQILQFQENLKEFQNQFYPKPQNVSQKFSILQRKKRYLKWKKRQDQLNQRKNYITDQQTYSYKKQSNLDQQTQLRNYYIQSDNLDQQHQLREYQKQYTYQNISINLLKQQQFKDDLKQIIRFYTYFYNVLNYITQLGGQSVNLINAFATPDENKCKQSVCGCYIEYLLTQNVFVDQLKTQIAYADSLVTNDVRNFIQATSVLEINVNSLAKLKNQLNYDVKNQTKASKLIKKKLLKTTIGYITISKQIFKNIVCDRVISMYNEIEISNNQTIQKIAKRLLQDYGEFVAAKCNVGIYYLQYSQQKQTNSMKAENFSISTDVSLPSNLQAQSSGGKHQQAEKNKKLKLVSKIYFKQPKIIGRQKYKISVSYTSDKIQGKIDQAKVIHRLSSKYYLLCGEYLNQKREIINLYFSGDIYEEFIQMIEKEQQKLKNLFGKETDFKQLQTSILQLDLEKYGDNLDALKQWKFENEMRQSKALLKLIAEIIPKLNTEIDKSQLEKLGKYLLFFDTPQKIYQHERSRRNNKLEQQLKRIMATLSEYEKKLIIKDNNKVAKNIFIRETKNELKESKKGLNYIKSYRSQIQNYYESNKSIKYFDELLISNILTQVKKMQEQYEKMQNGTNSQLDKLKIKILNKLSKMEYIKHIKQRFRQLLLDNILLNQKQKMKLLDIILQKSSPSQKLISQFLNCIVNTQKIALILDIFYPVDDVNIDEYLKKYLVKYLEVQNYRNSYIEKFKQLEQIINKIPIKKNIQRLKDQAKNANQETLQQVYSKIFKLSNQIVKNLDEVESKQKIQQIERKSIQFRSNPSNKLASQILILLEKLLQTDSQSKYLQKFNQNHQYNKKKLVNILSSTKSPNRQILIHHLLQLKKKDFISFYLDYLKYTKNYKQTQKQLSEKISSSKQQEIKQTKSKIQQFLVIFKNTQSIDKIVELFWKSHIQNQKKYLIQYLFEVKDSKSKILFKKYLSKNYDFKVHKFMLQYMKIKLEKEGCPLDQKNQIIQKIGNMSDQQINKICKLFMLYEQDNIIKQIMTDYFIADEAFNKIIKTNSQKFENHFQLIQSQQTKNQLLQYYLKDNINQTRNPLYQHLVNHLNINLRNLIKQKLTKIVHQKRASTSFTPHTLISLLLDDEFYRQFWIEFVVYYFLVKQQNIKPFVNQLIKVSKNDQKIKKQLIQFVTQYRDQFFFNILLKMKSSKNLKIIKNQKNQKFYQALSSKQSKYIPQNFQIQNQLKQIRNIILNEQIDNSQLLEQYFSSYVNIEPSIVKFLCEIVFQLPNQTIKQLFKSLKIKTFGQIHEMSNTVNKNFFISQIDKAIKFQFQKQLIGKYDDKYKQFFDYYVKHLWNKKIFKKIIYELPVIQIKQIIMKSSVNFLKIIMPTYSKIENKNVKSIFIQYILKPQFNNDFSKNMIELYINQEFVKNIFTDYLIKNQQGQKFLNNFLERQTSQKSYIIQHIKLSQHNIVQYLFDKDDQQKAYKYDYFLTKLQYFFQQKVAKINQLHDQLFQIGLINDMNIAVDSFKKSFGNLTINNPFKNRYDQQLSILGKHYEKLLQKSCQIDQYRISQLIKRKQYTWENKFNTNRKQKLDKYKLQYQFILWLKHFLKKLSITQRDFKAYDYKGNSQQIKNYAIRFKDLNAYEDQEGIRYLKGILVSQTMEMYCKLKYHNRLGLYSEEDKNIQIELEQVELNPVNIEPYYFLKYKMHNNFRPSMLKVTKQHELKALFYIIESDQHVKITI